MKQPLLRSFLALLCIAALILSCGCGNISDQRDPSNDPSTPTKDAAQLSSPSITELNYFFIDYMSQLLSDWYSLYNLQENDGFDPTIALDKQQYKGDPNKTWADHFTEQAIEECIQTYALCDAAHQAGYSLSEDEFAQIDSYIENMRTNAVSMYGYSSLVRYLEACYGGNHPYRVEEETFEEDYNLLLDFAKKHEHYTIDEQFSNLSFSFESTAHARAYNIAACAAIIGCTDIREIPEYVEKLPLGFDQTVFYTDYNKTLQWAEAEGSYDPQVLLPKIAIYEDFGVWNPNLDLEDTLPDFFAYYMIARYAEGLDDIRQLPDYLYNNPIVSSEESYRAYIEAVTLASSYYEHYLETHFRNYTDAQLEDHASMMDYVPEKDDRHLVTVRHILLSFDNYNKETAYAMTDQIMELWKQGGQTEEAFAELAQAYSDDDACDRGLYENIYPGWAVENFDAWCFDSSRQSGDCGVVETEYGIHLIYFVRTEEQTYWEYMVSLDLKASDAEAWLRNLTNSYRSQITLPDTSHLNTGYVFDPQ